MILLLFLLLNADIFSMFGLFLWMHAICTISWPKDPGFLKFNIVLNLNIFWESTSSLVLNRKKYGKVAVLHNDATNMLDQGIGNHKLGMLRSFFKIKLISECKKTRFPWSNLRYKHVWLPTFITWCKWMNTCDFCVVLFAAWICVVSSTRLACHHHISLAWCRSRRQHCLIHRRRRQHYFSSTSTMVHRLHQYVPLLQHTAATTTFLLCTTSSTRILWTFPALSIRSSSSRRHSHSALPECMTAGRVHLPHYQVCSRHLITSFPVWVQSIVISMSVCLPLSVCLSAGIAKKPLRTIVVINLLQEVIQQTDTPITTSSVLTFYTISTSRI